MTNAIGMLFIVVFFLLKGCSLLALIYCISTDSNTEIRVTIIDHVTYQRDWKPVNKTFGEENTQWWGENVQLDYSIVRYIATKMRQIC